MATTSIRALQDFQTTPFPELEKQMKRGERAEDLRLLYGDELAAEMQQMVASEEVRVLSGAARPLIILLPGIMGSTLRNIRGEIGLIWLNPIALVQGRLRLVRLAPDGTTNAEPTEIIASGLIPKPYFPLYLHLRWSGCDVLSFPYDWRRAPSVTAEVLAAFVRQQRIKDNRPIHLVCHSMGGLVARHYCRLYPDEASSALAQIVLLGTPNYGSVDAVQNLTIGSKAISLLTRLNAANDPLGIVRSAPGVYSLLPAPRVSYPTGHDVPPYPFTEEFNCYDVGTYQVEGVSADHLGTAQNDYMLLANTSLPVPMTVIAGSNLPTAAGVIKVQPADDRVMFDFETHLSLDGDGTVLTASVVALPGAARYYVKNGRHLNLPEYPGVRRAVEALVHGDEPDLPTSPDKVLSAQDLADIAGVPEAPLPGTISEAELEVIAERIRRDMATPEDLTLLSHML